MPANRCPNCGEATVVPGRLVASEGTGIVGFAPAFTRSQVTLPIAFQACSACGNVWSSVAPEELRNAIETRGREVVKQHLASGRSGPYHDLPDIPEAKQAADAVTEIDALFLAGDGLVATRRYRQLTGKTWDEVHAVMSKWADLARADKLAIFGWHPKGKPAVEKNAEPRGHPMHDRLLDG
jgi:hypothetical protein